MARTNDMGGGLPSSEPHRGREHRPGGPPPSGLVAGAEALSASREVPDDTTPTWELEMLVSGVVIFGLFQLPPLLDRGFDALLPRFAGSAEQLVSVGLTLTEAVVFALILAFVVHVVSRTYWVALVGLHSVYPDGVRWDRLRRGPIFLESVRSRDRSLPQRIASVDNFCSVIFAFAFLSAAMVVFGAVMLSVATALSLGFSRIVLGGRRVAELPTFLVVLFAMTLVVLHRLDRRYGSGLPRDGGRARALRNAFAFARGISGQALYGPILNTLMSNVRRRVMVPGLVGLIAISVLAASIHRGVLRGHDVSDAYSYVPARTGEMRVDPRSYADERTGVDALSAVPFIQSDMIRDPYVRLFIPYVPDRDNLVLDQCSGAAPRAEEGQSEASARAAVILRCLSAMHSVEVDGRPLAEPDFRFYRDPRSGLMGIVTYISVAGLPRGRNVLSLIPSPPMDSAGTVATASRTTIPFWL